jgi:hypothetical protein
MIAPDPAALQSRQAEWAARRFHVVLSMVCIVARIAFKDGRIDLPWETS